MLLAYWRYACDFLQAIFEKNYGIFDLEYFEVRFQLGVARLCQQLLSELSSIQFETLHRYYKQVEDVHVTFAHKYITIDTISAILTLTFQKLVYSID